MSDHEDEINEIMGQATAEMFGEKVDEIVRHLSALDAKAALASQQGDEEAVQECAASITMLIANIPWGVLPSVLMSAVKSLNMERLYAVNTVQAVHDQAKSVGQVLRLLANNDSIPASQLRSLMNTKESLDKIVMDSPYESTVDR